MPETAQTGGPASAKLCGTCGLDCSGKPRAKDPQGNYMCVECVDRAKSAREAQVAVKQSAPSPKPAPKPAPKLDLETVNLADDADNSFLVAMSESEAAKADETMKPCPNCFKRMALDSVMCVNCGFNTKRGEQLHVRVLRPKEEKTRTERSDGHSFFSRIFGGFSPSTFFFAIILTTAGPAAVGLMADVAPLFFIGLFLLMLVSLVVHIAIIIDAFKSSPTYGFLLFTGFFWGYYMFFKCESEELKTSWFGLYASSIVIVVCALMMPEVFKGMVTE